MSEVPGTGPRRPLSGAERIFYFVSGTLWATVAAVVCTLDWVTGHVLDGLILDFVYVTAGIVAYLQIRAVWTGYASGDLTFRGEYRRVRAHFDTYRKWLVERVRGLFR